MSLSMADVAFEILSERKKSMHFSDLWKGVCSRMDFKDSSPNNKMSQFFTNLTLDNRFALINNNWDIRSRHKLEEVILDTSALEIDEDDDEDLLSDDEKGYEEESEDDDE